ncbi:FHA domain-containing protein [Lyngbya aestuarii]|uniref:FHA domain-containing protein n=1 Tax=Lyngbya aestuarii TaxID=118322 RepID=UPI00403D76F6
MQVQLRWEEPVTGEERQLAFRLPVALGRELSEMPSNLNSQQVHHAVFRSEQVSRWHVLIILEDEQLFIEDCSSHGSLLNGEHFYHSRRSLGNGDTLQIGPYNITATLLAQVDSQLAAETSSANSTIIIDPEETEGVEEPPLQENGDTKIGGEETAELDSTVAESGPATQLPDYPAPEAASELPSQPVPEATSCPAPEEEEEVADTPTDNAEDSLEETETTATEEQEQTNSASTIFFNPDTDLLEPQITEPLAATTPQEVFPPPDIFAAEQVSIEALQATGKAVEETNYVAIGGGMGSFAWVDTLRIYGVKPGQIVILSVEKQPYGRYQRLCQNSQIPDHERLRSGSDSCPDNIWGWPGYALREAVRELLLGRFGAALKCLWQVFAEPVFADTYTPRSADVFASLDRETRRIGWDKMLVYGRVRSIRKTEDGRYVIAYSVPREEQREHRFLLAEYVHIATGYPAVRFLPDLQDYRAKTGDFKSVVNAYENHEHVYQSLAQQGGTVIVRGRGIVASRIIQRLYELRHQECQIKIIHLMRSPKPQGNRFGLAQRHVENQWEFQPYNWPKGTWGGDMRAILEAADPAHRRELLTDWGGTTTANRQKWRQIVHQGMQEGWYTIKFGTVETVKSKGENKVVACIKSGNYQGLEKIQAAFIIDSTGLEAKPKYNPLLDDLVTHYSLPLNPFGRLQVANDFEMREMRNHPGRIYAAGIITLGGPYAPVDTFLGLQYCAHRSVESLARLRASRVRYLEGLRSLCQWLKWATNLAP